METSESKHLEWKITPPFGPMVTKKIKYRMVKALVSFANTEGGFIVFGVNPQGEWVGFSAAELENTDAAMIGEIVNECINPDLVVLNYGLLRKATRLFPVVHVPPSQLMPHVTTKEIVEKQSDGKYACYLHRHAVYCRYSAKSDLATATQYGRIITQRTEMLRNEMLRVVRKVDIPSVVAATSQSTMQKPFVRISRLTDDKTVPAFRVTRNPAEATGGTIVYEELSQGLFAEINHVLDANQLLAPDERSFVLGENIYYRVYAERQHVDRKAALFEMLANTAFVRFYAPSLFWLLQLPARSVAEIIQRVLKTPHSTHMHLVCRIAILLGNKATDWLSDFLEQEWHGHAQPPGYYFSFKKMKRFLGDGADPRIIALQQSAGSKIKLLPGAEEVSVRELLADAQRSANLLSKTCMAVFNGDSDLRPACRQLDILAHGLALPRLCNGIIDKLSRSNSSR